MRHKRFILMIFTVFVFAVSSFVALKRHNQTIDLLSITGKTTAWTVVRLESEYLKFMQVVHLYALNELDIDTLMIRFELLWSRTDVLLIGEESRELRQQPMLVNVVLDLQASLDDLESVIENLQPGKNDNYRHIVTTLDPYYQLIRDIVVANFRGKYSHYEQMKRNNIQIEIGFYLTGFVFSGLILLWFLWRESRRNHALALEDALTKLPNRVNFYRKLALAETFAKKHRLNFALLLIDLNGFKQINDKLGHDAGDQILIAVASRLRYLLSSQDTVARLGGDEFVIIKNGLDNREQAKLLAQQVVDTISNKYDLSGKECSVTASVGISLYPLDSLKVEQLQINADMAMYKVKKEQEGGYQFYDPDMFNSLLRRKQLANDLVDAIENDQLRLLYQPLFSFACGKIECVEALLRWSHPKYGPISPPEIIDIASQYGLGTRLDKWVLLTACRQNMLWQQAGLEQIQTSVNISPAMYRCGDLQQAVEDVLKSTGLCPKQLMIEVTETTTMSDIEASPDVLFMLASLGVELALDDFGTGYSSLSHLKNLPLNKLKIDRSFITDLGQDPNALRFIHTIVQLGKNLNMKLVVEGIETKEQYELLAAEGCEQVQGFYLAKPQSGSKISELLAQQMSDISPACDI